jgi:hypothetical protein
MADGKWVTLKSHTGMVTHVHLDDSGNIDKGPHVLLGHNIAHLPASPSFPTHPQHGGALPHSMDDLSPSADGPGMMNEILAKQHPDYAYMAPGHPLPAKHQDQAPGAYHQALDQQKNVSSLQSTPPPAAPTPAGTDYNQGEHAAKAQAALKHAYDEGALTTGSHASLMKKHAAAEMYSPQEAKDEYDRLIRVGERARALQHLDTAVNKEELPQRIADEIKLELQGSKRSDQLALMHELLATRVAENAGHKETATNILKDAANSGFGDAELMPHMQALLSPKKNVDYQGIGTALNSQLKEKVKNDAFTRGLLGQQDLEELNSGDTPTLSAKSLRLQIRALSSMHALTRIGNLPAGPIKTAAHNAFSRALGIDIPDENTDEGRGQVAHVAKLHKALGLFEKQAQHDAQASSLQDKTASAQLGAVQYKGKLAQLAAAGAAGDTIHQSNKSFGTPNTAPTWHFSVSGVPGGAGPHEHASFAKSVAHSTSTLTPAVITATKKVEQAGLYKPDGSLYKPQQLKASTSKTLGDRFKKAGITADQATALYNVMGLYDNFHSDPHEKLASGILQRWQHQVSNSVGSSAIQQAASELFGTTWWNGSKPPFVTQENYDQGRAIAANPAYSAPLKAALSEIYNNTQEYYKARGITHVAVARGVKRLKHPAFQQAAQAAFDSGKDSITYQLEPGSADEIPLSSFATDPMVCIGKADNPYKTSMNFQVPNGNDVSSGGISTVLYAQIPVEHIFSCPHTGQGCLGESEVGVLGHARAYTAIAAKGSLEPYVPIFKKIQTNGYTPPAESAIIGNTRSVSEASRRPKRRVWLDAGSPENPDWIKMGRWDFHGTPEEQAEQVIEGADPKDAQAKLDAFLRTPAAAPMPEYVRHALRKKGLSVPNGPTLGREDKIGETALAAHNAARAQIKADLQKRLSRHLPPS